MDRDVSPIGLLLTVAALPGWWPSVPSWLGTPMDGIQAQVHVLVLDSPTMGVGLPKVGYVTVSHDTLTRTLDWAVQQSGAELESLAGNQVVVDLHTATQRLIHMVTRTP